MKKSLFYVGIYLSMLGLCACSYFQSQTIDYQQGQISLHDIASTIHIGQSKQSVINAIGMPLLNDSAKDDKQLIYISQSVSNQQINTRHLTLVFDQNQTLQQIIYSPVVHKRIKKN
jgi:outer membrane protein assembly factor BamE (lipoprotein component of BamABCDE complex)